MADILKYNDTPIYDLQEVIQQYQSQPELLKLILSSKVEEDKRRAEEAKLRAKELDLCSPPSFHKMLPPLQDYNKRARAAPYTIPKSRSYNHSSSISSASSSSSSMSFEEETDFTLDQRRHSAAAAMLAMGGSLIETPPIKNQEKSHEELVKSYPSPRADQYSDELDSTKPKRKREMQAITRIVETRDFPYIDNYFWKNNGNTIQKKTGCKSIYYKCSNSNKGCSVNKTVTARPNGEYLIKYRGCHLSECGRVERIRDL